jgi:hypothetical protein
LIPDIGIIICSRNVVFEEGLGYCTLMAERELSLSDNNVDVDLPTDSIAIQDTPPNLDMADLPMETTMNQNPV